MFDIGFQELVVIFLVALVVFGPEKLPEVGRTLGKWTGEIKKAIAVAKVQMETELHETEKKPGNDIASYVPDELKHSGGQTGAGEQTPEASEENTVTADASKPSEKNDAGGNV